jgi:hypothetical protein
LLDALADALERDVDADRVDDAMNAVAAALQRVGNSCPPVGPRLDASSKRKNPARAGQVASERNSRTDWDRGGWGCPARLHRVSRALSG